MRIIAKGTLRAFWRRHPDAEQPLRSWYSEARKAEWRNPHDVKRMYRSVSVVGHGRIVFNIAGNKYRLVTLINFHYGVTYIRFVGTHAEYDEIDAERI